MSGSLLCSLLFALLGLAASFKVSLAESAALLLILLAGIPHGAFDLRFAQLKWAPLLVGPISTGVFYFAIGLAMSGLCLVLPGTGLLVFLLLSVVHFAEGEGPHSLKLTALVFGLASILLPIAFHPEAARGYLSFFVPPAHFVPLVPLLQAAGRIVFCAAAALLAFDAWQGRRTELTERLVCLAAWLLLPPLSGFAVWFLGRHSRQHLVACRQLFGSARGLPSDFLALSVLPLLLLIPLFLRFDPRDLNQLFAASIILVAGLTLPHIIVTRGLAHSLTVLGARER